MSFIIRALLLCSIITLAISAIAEAHYNKVPSKNIMLCISQKLFQEKCSQSFRQGYQKAQRDMLNMWLGNCKFVAGIILMSEYFAITAHPNKYLPNLQNRFGQIDLVESFNQHSNF